MEKSSPLLSETNSTDDESTLSLDPISQFSSLDDMVEQSLGGFGCSQLIQVLLVSLLLIFDAQQTFLSVYTDAEPTWHCTNSSTCNSSSNICNLSKSSWAWDGPSHKTIISAWSLECASSILIGLPSSCFLVGCLLGGFVLSTHGDSSLGRKKLLLLSCFAMSITAFTTIFSTDIWIYSSFRFVCGCFRASIVTTTLVLLMEKVGKRWRGQAGIIGFFSFSLGTLTLPALAYINRNSSWKTLYVWTSVPGILYCIAVFPFLSESPRWLLIHGYKAEALAVLRKLASSSSSVNFDSLNLSLSNIPLQEEVQKFHLYSFMKEMFNRKWALRRLLLAMGAAFGIGLAYYGLLLGVGNLDSNIYLSLTFNALLEIPAYFLSFFVIEKWKRTSSMLAFCIVSGICSIICGIIGNGQKVLQFGPELASFFTVCVAFNVLLIYVTELFPTSVRNSSASMVRQAVSFGAAFSPMLISAGRQNGLVSFGAFGLFVLCSGGFLACLPETKGVPLCETLDEQERLDGNSVHVT